ncbi:hypothetical protein GOP47_0004679 [Adiantum capillus-veneris]|uniref:DUF7032 domain-containing protein n=1 Tax=Adiantum capillus-veneris TaxID=13818 RepID=A0A9D4V7W3_ADICA|nr:hypothetical protein GOP47_0004679 [Adiantum capillus-veneris]
MEDLMRNACELCAHLLSEAALVQSFKGRWMVICARLQRLSETLEALSSSACLEQYFLHLRASMVQIVSSLEEGKKLVRRSIELNYGGKLLMQSNLDALATKLDLHLQDVEVVKSGIRQRERAIAISNTTSEGDSKINHDRNSKKNHVWDMFTKLRIGSIEVKKATLEALIQYMKEDEKAVLVVGYDGDLPRLIHLLDSNAQAIRERAAHAISLLAVLEEFKKLLVADGAHPPLIRILESGSLFAREKAVLSLLELTYISENAHAVASHGGIPLLVKLCRHGTPTATACAAGTLRNLATNEHIRRSLAEEGAVEALINLVTSGTCEAQEQAVEALQYLASGKDDKIRTVIGKHGGIQCLMMFLKHAPSSKSQDTAIRALSNLATSAANAKALVSAGYVNQLTDLLKTGSSSVQQVAAAGICSLSSYIDLKKQLGEAGCIGPLTQMLEAKNITEQEVAAQALSTLLLVNSNRKEFCKEEKGISRLVQLLDPRNQSIAKRFPMSALLALSGSSTYRKRIMSAGARPHLEKLAEMNVVGAKKTLDKIGGKKLLSFFSRHKS